jgi:hypothetical protein
MSVPLVFSLQSIRTDGWFERIGEGIGSFQALCDIIGAHFFAFAMITGARITALTVDRRNPDNTLVDFVVGGAEAEATPQDAQRLTLGDFRRRLVVALTTEEPLAPAPSRLTDTEALQLHLGVRYLLLAPLYGYGLEEAVVDERGTTLRVLHDGVEQVLPLLTFRARVRSHVQDELERAAQASPKGSIDLGRVTEAERAAARGDHIRVLELLGAWPAPLAIFLRTPEGQLLNQETRSTIARGLGLLGSACIALDEVDKGEEVLRLAVQYAGDGASAGEIFLRLGGAMHSDARPGEAIAPLRRAIILGAEPRQAWPMLADALLSRNRCVAALAAVLEARSRGVDDPQLDHVFRTARERLGGAAAAWEKLVGENAARPTAPAGPV